MTRRINRCSHCGCDEPIHNPIDGKLYCNNCGMSLEKLEGGLTMEKVDLKSCPFCGAKYSAEKFTKNTVQLMEGTACFWAICLNCGVRTGEYCKPEDAAAVWNRRADDV